MEIPSRLPASPSHLPFQVPYGLSLYTFIIDLNFLLKHFSHLARLSGLLSPCPTPSSSAFQDQLASSKTNNIKPVRIFTGT